jgi:RNA polymerase-binding transcription factor DksA
MAKTSGKTTVKQTTPAKSAAAKSAAEKVASPKAKAGKAAAEESTASSRKVADLKAAPTKAAAKTAPKPVKIVEPEPADDMDTNEQMPVDDVVTDDTHPIRLAARPKVRYSDEDLKMFRKHIEAERKRSYEEFQILKENLEDMINSEMADENASYSMHMAEQGTNAQEKEKTYAHVQRLGDYIKKLDEALQRIDDKVYGICRMCGILIAKERLMAVPITTQSASYKIFKKCPEDGIDRIKPLKK